MCPVPSLKYHCCFGKKKPFYSGVFELWFSWFSFRASEQSAAGTELCPMDFTFCWLRSFCCSSPHKWQYPYQREGQEGKLSAGWILPCGFLQLSCYFYFNCILKITVVQAYLVNLREAEELVDVTYFNSLPRVLLQVLCNYCFSSPAKELAHRFGTSTDFQLPHKPTWTKRRGKSICMRETAFI